MYPFKEPIEEVSYFGSDLLPAILRTLVTTGFYDRDHVHAESSIDLGDSSSCPCLPDCRQHFRRRLSVDSDFVQADRASWSEFLEEHLSSVIPIQLLGQQKRQERKAFQRLAHSVRSQQRLFRTGVWFTVGSSFAVVLSMCAVVEYGGAKVIAGALSLGSLVAFYSFITQLFEPLSGAAELYARTQKTFASIRQVQGPFALTPRIANAAIPIPLSKNILHRLILWASSLGTSGRRTCCIFPPFEFGPEENAIVGENGAGKSHDRENS